MDTATLILICVGAIGIVCAIPVPASDSDALSLNADGGDCKTTDQQQICKVANEVACFFQVNDPRRNGAINTKIQSEPYETYYLLRCSRAQKFDSLYTLADDQTSDNCKNAINFSDLN